MRHKNGVYKLIITLDVLISDLEMLRAAYKEIGVGDFEDLQREGKTIRKTL